MIVLDAGAFIAMCKREKGAFELRRLLDAHRNETFLHAVNSLEIFYGIERDFGRPQAERVWRIADRSKIVTVTTSTAISCATPPSSKTRTGCLWQIRLPSLWRGD